MTPSVHVIHAAGEAEHFAKLKMFLTPAIRKSRLTLSATSEAIGDGAQWERERIAAADLVVLLVSVSLLNTCEEPVQHAMTRARLGLIPVIPVLLSYCNPSDTIFGGLVMLPRNTRHSFVAQFQDRDEAWDLISRDLLAAIAHLPEERRQRQARLEALRQPGRVRILLASATTPAVQAPSIGLLHTRLRAQLESLGLLSRFDVQVCEHADVTALSAALAAIHPHVIHFHAHGTDRAELLLEGLQGEATAVSPVALRQLFTDLDHRPTLVVLGCCFVAAQADVLSKVADACIGFPVKVKDSEAVAFAEILYTWLSQGQTISAAFEKARGALEDRTAVTRIGDGKLLPDS